MGAGRLRWWSSGESRSDLNSRLHEQWQKEQGEKGFLPQSERWPTIRSDDLWATSSPPSDHQFVRDCVFEMPLPPPGDDRGDSTIGNTGSTPGHRSYRIGYRRLPLDQWYGNTKIVSCPHVPEGTSYLFQGEFNCALCAKEKAMNRIEYNSPLGWSVGVIRDLYASADHIEVVAKAGVRKHSFPFVINLSRPAIGELEEALQYVAGKGFEPHEVRASQHVFIQLEKFMDDMRTASSLAAIINAPPPTVAGLVDLAEYYLKEKHIGPAEYLGILDTGRLPEEKEAVTLTSPTGDKVTLHVPKEQPMSSITTQERHEKEYGPAKPIGPDVVCACCGKSAPRKFGCAPAELRYGLVADDDGWMIWVFPLARLLEPCSEREMTKLCPPCAKEVAEHVTYLKTKKSGEAFGLSDEDLLADDA